MYYIQYIRELPLKEVRAAEMSVLSGNYQDAEATLLQVRIIAGITQWPINSSPLSVKATIRNVIINFVFINFSIINSKLSLSQVNAVVCQREVAGSSLGKICFKTQYTLYTFVRLILFFLFSQMPALTIFYLTP